VGVGLRVALPLFAFIVDMSFRQMQNIITISVVAITLLFSKNNHLNAQEMKEEIPKRRGLFNNQKATKTNCSQFK